MEDLGTEKVLMGERMGHLDGSVSARYAQTGVECCLLSARAVAGGPGRP